MPVPVDVVVAVHHPVRRRLLEVLGLDGPATASLLADRTGQLVGNVSHHLKVLARAGLVVEDPELARDRRERWWRAANTSISWSIADVLGDPAGEALLAAAEQQNLAHQVGRLQHWLGTREAADPALVAAAVAVDGWVEVTPEELTELGRELQALLERYRAGRRPEPEPGEAPRERAFVFAHAFPAQP